MGQCQKRYNLRTDVSIDKYKKDPAWSYFNDFRPLSELAGVAEVDKDDITNPIYFDLQGRELTKEPEKGLYIVKSGNTTKKIIK